MMLYIKDIDGVSGSFGGKANGLIFLRQNQFSVPNFFVIPYSTLVQITNGQILAEEMFAQWMLDEQIEKQSLWALRSSADIEDGAQQSFAGLFTTELNVATTQLHLAMLKVLDGFAQIAQTGYTDSTPFEYHIILQEMIPSEISGVGFSRHPFDPQEKAALVNVLPGLGTKLVSGEENALSVLLPNNAPPEIISSEDQYTGIRSTNGTDHAIQVSHNILTTRMAPFWDDIRQGLAMLAKLKKQAVDTEFCIFQDRLYWLQTRPITSPILKEPFSIWDNSNISINFPGVVCPLTSSFTIHSYTLTYQEMSKFIGADHEFIEKNKHLYHKMTGSINGSLYYNVTAWQQLLYQMPFGKLTSQYITKMFGAENAQFEKPNSKISSWAYIKLAYNLLRCVIFFSYYRNQYLARFESMKKNFLSWPLPTLDHKALVDGYLKMQTQMGHHWHAPLINGFFTMLSYNTLKKIFANNKVMQKQHPNFLNDALMHSGDVISVKIVRTLGNLLHTLHSDLAVKEIFLAHEPPQILEIIKNQHTKTYIQIIDYIDLYGERCDDGELKMETINYKEDPLSFINFLKKNMAFEYKVPSQTESTPPNKVLKSVFGSNPLRYLVYKALLRFTIKRVRDRENFRFIRTQTFDMVRRLFRQIDHQLLEKNHISTTGDSLYLHFEELTNVDLCPAYKNLIADRKAIYTNYREQEIETRYLENEAGLFPIIAKAAGKDTNSIKGLGCCSGTVSGRVIKVTAENIHEVDIKDHIAVATYFEPGWIGLFARAKGLISEKGSLLSHTAILCREMGIPTIVGAKNISKTLQTGDYITMNGALGTIEIIKDNK